MTDMKTVLSTLGYEDSPHFIRDPSMAASGVYSILRQLRAPCFDSVGFEVEGVFVYETDKTTDMVSQNIALCVASAESKEALTAVRRVVWNTGVIPFLLVLSDGAVRLYQTFSYDESTEALIEDASRALKKMIPIRADEIDTGRLWHSDLAQELTPKNRVDQRLLRNLRELRSILRERDVPSKLIHKLIGKFMYFRYLDDRGILSDRFLKKRGLSREDVFSSAISPESFQKFSSTLEKRFNGELFEIDFEAEAVAPSTLCLFADVFNDSADVTGLQGKAVKQLVLDFVDYNFEYIPVELLSKVYELFLHESGEGEEAAAFYTPEYLAEYVLNDLHAQCPMHSRMKVLDPACGSGIFLSLAYRRLIENKLRETGKNSLKPDLLREMLLASIFGVEKNGEACGITAFSLILTLLHYVDPPALDLHEDFQFPSLIGSNILEADFFNPEVLKKLGDRDFDWIAGNPPWMALSEEDQNGFSGDWVREHKEKRPVPRKRIELAFAWRALDFVKQQGAVGFVLPSAGLINDTDIKFRREFLSQATLCKVTNLSHVRRLLFHGAIQPPSVWIYNLADSDGSAESIKHFAPKSIHIPTLQGDSLWAITVAESDIQHIIRRDVEQGESVPWKIAQWGCSLDSTILGYLDRRHEPLMAYLENEGFASGCLARAPEFRTVEVGEVVPEGWPLMRNYKGRSRVSTKKFNRFDDCGVVFSMPSEALETLETKDCYLRKRGGTRGLSVCSAPLLFIGASWGNAFVFSKENLIIPSGHFGLAGRSLEDIPLLKAIAVYLSSSLVKYWMFFNNPGMGDFDSKNRVTLQHLKRIPIPVLNAKQIEAISALYDRFVAEEQEVVGDGDDFKLKSSDCIHVAKRQAQIDREIGKLLKLPRTVKNRIEDFIKFTVPLAEKPQRLNLFCKKPTTSQFARYGKTLVNALDGFAAGELHHSVSIAVSGEMSCCTVTFRKTAPLKEKRVVVEMVDSKEKSWVAILKKQLSVHVAPAFYLQRNLRVYNSDQVQIFKATQEPDWSCTQAHTDAGIIISEALRGDESAC